MIDIPVVERPLRIVAWNCNMALGRKSGLLAGLDPDIAVVSECSAVAEVPDLESVGWTGKSQTKGLGVFARPQLQGSIDPRHDPERQWFLPVNLAAIDLDVLAIWAMNQRGGEGERRGRTHRALDHYAPFLGRRRAVVIGDFNNNVQWDTPRFPEFTKLAARLGELGYASVYHARTGERHGAESAASLFQYRHIERPYLVDHAYVPQDWLPSIEGFEVAPAAAWLRASDHVPLVLDLRLPLPGRTSASP